jgi:outer membrane protein OmpA-like peptidoglycan-associated protein
MLRSRLMPHALSLVLLLAAASAAAQDKPSCKGKDHPLFSRMPGFNLMGCEETQFKPVKVPTQNEKKQRVDKAVEGHYFRLDYKYGGAPPAPGRVQVGRNYAEAAKAAGGEVLYGPDGYGTTTVRFAKAGKETWAVVGVYSGYTLTIVEVEAMKQDVTANADALKGGLASNGHVELVGLFFDTGKSVLKPESDAALGEVEKLLKAQPQLALWVVGHTDSVGSVESNMGLAQARAAAVIQELEKRGIGAQRLAPFGNGPYAPVATNTTEEGRAKNRRVELVAR